jgi:DNA-directed RNA polymerase specialized sigma24 family protein
MLHYTAAERVKRVQPVRDAPGRVVGGNVTVRQIWFDNQIESDTALIDPSEVQDVPWTVTYAIDVLSSGAEASIDDAIDALYSAQGGYLEPVPAWQQPDKRAEQRQMMTVLERWVSAMPRQTGRVFMMREWLGFENVEICERLGFRADNCRATLHRARMALRTCMQCKWLKQKAGI